MSGAATFAWTLPPGPPLTEEQRARVAEAYPLAEVVVRTLMRREPFAMRYWDELQGAAAEGLVWAAQRYDASRGSRWLSYAYGGALMRCRVYLRALRLREMRDLDTILATGPGGEEFTRLDVTPDPSPPADELLLRRRVIALVERLPERERLAVRRGWDDATLEQVAAAHGVTREAVRQWELSGMQRLRELAGLVPRRRKRSRGEALLRCESRLLELLNSGQPRTRQELAQLTGYTPQGVGVRLKAMGAVQVSPRVPGKQGATWALPRAGT